MSLQTGIAGKVALVTGGGTGLGRAIGRALAAEGAHIVIASRHKHDDAISEMRAAGVRSAFIEVDLRDEAQVRTLADRAVDLMGGLDLVVCNAAEALHEPIAASTTAAWERTLQTNLLSTMWLCRSAFAHMRSKASGAILIIGSTTQYHYTSGEAGYHVSKVALAAFARSFAVEAAPIRVNLLVPGRFPSSLNPRALSRGADDIPLGRVGALDDIGPAAVFLLSDALASYVTGAELVVSGGLHLR